MKNFVFKLALVCSLLFLPLLSEQLKAQPLPPFYHNQNGNQAEGAPLDGGISCLIVLGAAYGSRKIQLLSKKKQRK